MSDDLYFVRMLSQAFRASDTEAALREAFRRIQTMGQEPPYRRGYHQFLQFMAEWGSRRGYELTEESLQELVAGLEPPLSFTLRLQRKREEVASLTFEEPPCEGSVGSITPGDYRMIFQTGLVLWEGCVERRDVLWTEAFPSKPLTLAADTGGIRQEPTRTENLASAGLVLRLYAGLEAGVLRIAWDGGGAL